MDDFEEEDRGLYNFKPKDVADMSPSERNTFINLVYEDYKFVLKERMPAPIIEYHRDVLITLIKTYGH